MCFSIYDFICVIFARHFAHFPNTEFGKLRGDGGSIVQSTFIELDLVGGQLGILAALLVGKKHYQTYMSS